MKEDKGEDSEHFSSNVQLETVSNTVKRDTSYTRLLSHYVENQAAAYRQQRWFKTVFFLVVCLVFAFVVVAGALGILIISQKEDISWGDFGAALMGLGSVFGVIIVLPNKIVDNLFPSSDNEVNRNVVSDMQSYDTARREQSIKKPVNEEVRYQPKDSDILV